MARRAQAGFTLVEAMAAMAVLIIGSLGLLSLHKLSLQLNDDARITTRATALAEDLVAQMRNWDYAKDPRLQDKQTANDANFAENDDEFDKTDLDDKAYDHAEPDLKVAPFAGATALPPGFSRYLIIAELPADLDGNGVLTGRRVAVIVRWVKDGRARHVRLTTFIPNPQATN